MAAGTAQWRTAEAWRRLLRERSIIPLTALLFLLVGVYSVVRPGVVNGDWVEPQSAGRCLILAACQTRRC